MSQEHAIELGDVVDVLRDYSDNVFDAVLCDPPYGLSFMGKRWDYDVPSVDLWREVWRVLKPGAPLIAFGGTRTYHRLVVNIEDAGFEIRDQLLWLFGSGFPKSLDVSKAIDKAAGHWRGRAGKVLSANVAMTAANYERTPKGDPITAAAAVWAGYGTALKPAVEPAVLARKPLEGTVFENVTKWGVGALAIDACRIEGLPRDPGTKNPEAKKGSGVAYCGSDGAKQIAYSAKLASGEIDGRWPANVILDEEAGAMLDAQTGERRSTLTGRADPSEKHAHPADAGKTRDFMFGNARAGGAVYADSGGASRFFYCPKANRRERDMGCEDLPVVTRAEATGRKEGSTGSRNLRSGAGSTLGSKNTHPTVKPIALCEYLARLIMPPKPDAILVPFAGSGSEMIGALRAGWPVVVGIEREMQYVEIARRRLAAAMKAA